MKNTLLLGIGLATAAASQAAIVTISQTDWNSGSWEGPYVAATGGGTADAFQVPTGGIPDAFLEIHNYSANDNIISSVFLSQQFVPSPSFLNISGQFDHERFYGGQGVAIAIRQNGKNYFGPMDLSYPASWATIAWTGLTANSFTSSEGGHPDFTQTGGSFQVGIANWNVAMGNRNTYGGFDNYKVTMDVIPVPEPSTYLAGLSALGMLGFFGWRNRK